MFNTASTLRENDKFFYITFIKKKSSINAFISDQANFSQYNEAYFADLFDRQIFV